MLLVKTPDEVFEILQKEFKPLNKNELVNLKDASGRILAEDIISKEFIPNFSRSTVDGFAVNASDTFGCSEAIPAILTLQGKIKMGDPADEKLCKGCCFDVPTGGALPEGADAVVMLEYTEDYGDGTIGIFKAAAPGENYVFKGDDLKPGDIILHKGRKLLPADIGSLAAMGRSRVLVSAMPRVGIISTGDELVGIDEEPKEGQIRDVNSVVLYSLMKENGAVVTDYGITKDNESTLREVLTKALEECDLVLISGGSSAGEKDKTAMIIGEQGRLLFHGIAIKPGKPTILGISNETAIFGLPGHPAAAFFIANSFVVPVLKIYTGENKKCIKNKAVLTEAIDANHGRTQLTPVRLFEENGTVYAKPVISKSGLITALAETNHYIVIERNTEGLSKGEIVEVIDVL